ncbi:MULTISPECIES: ureidoglycolate dehydrogenase [Oceanobacillus]|uniref:ureidoglycolate dehydrogenase n=1 Tax=Oceanobacillus TaxID=182709 RepID=UPI00084E485C|nr:MULTISPECIES: ureidoglycolate dehydrogenase [Oceanobacillus]MBT2653158.1 ureidoglycolate dehydrogenase [Oceanobacillus sp. ISL-73]OEH53882.1 ureidoglycolate dehydrogenase [Oceanobacillus sp. E9]
MILKDELTQMTKKVFEKYGIEEEIANIITDVLVHANLRGVDSHGVLRVEHYIKRIKEGGINPKPVLQETDTSPSTSILDGDNGFGHYISKEAMNIAIKKAKQTGTGAVAVQNSSHCGALSYFVQQAAKNNLIGIAMTHTDKVVVPFGGAEPFFGTNPIAFGFPANKEEAIILDFATSTVALGKILNAKEKGEKIPHGWGVDNNGEATIDPNEVVALSPFGGPKGYGLAMVVEIFSSMLTGAAFGPHISKMYGDYDKNRELGHFFMAIDPSKFVSIEVFTTRLDAMIQELRNTTPSTHVERVFIPGEIENITAKKRETEGIPLPKSVYTYIKNESENY